MIYLKKEKFSIYFLNNIRWLIFKCCNCNLSSTTHLHQVIKLDTLSRAKKVPLLAAGR